MSKKRELGQFFTRKNIWLRPHIKDFLCNSGCCIAYDPFAGAGDLLKTATQLGFTQTIGMDIDPSLKWTVNDSLKNIPEIKNSIILTNPPYLAKQSATRRKMNLNVYFDKSQYDDLYLIALNNMIHSAEKVIAIIPESFINSGFVHKDLLHSITVLEENPFNDTECPVCVVCFDGKHKPLSHIGVYKNDTFINTLQFIHDLRMIPKNHISIRFNDVSGWLGLRAIDSTDDKTFIRFDYKDNFQYDWTKIKVSSRHFTLINIDIPPADRTRFINIANDITQQIRDSSSDLLLTPFMGNTKSGIRRRRLDFTLTRAVLEQAYEQLYGEHKNAQQFLLF